MKLFKKISAIVLATAMFGMSAMAGNITAPSTIEVASDATQVTLTLSVEEGTTMGAFAASFILYYDTEIFSYNSELSTCGYGAVDNTPDNDACIMWGTSSNVTVTADNTTLASFVFDVVEGADPNGAEFTLGEDDWQMYIDEDFSDILPFPENSVIKVVVEQTEEPEPDPEPVPGTTTDAVTLEGTESYMTVVDDNKATRFVVMDEKTAVSATAATVLKATYAGTTKQANLYNLLGVDGDGDVTIGKITIKMVLPADVTTAPTAADFGFVVE